MIQAITAFCLGYIFKALTYKPPTETDNPKQLPKPKWFWRIFVTDYDN